MQDEQLEELRRLVAESKESAKGTRRRYRLSLSKAIGVLLSPLMGASMLCGTSFGGSFWDYFLACLAMQVACYAGSWGALLGGETKF